MLDGTFFFVEALDSLIYTLRGQTAVNYRDPELLDAVFGSLRIVGIICWAFLVASFVAKAPGAVWVSRARRAAVSAAVGYLGVVFGAVGVFFVNTHLVFSAHTPIAEAVHAEKLLLLWCSDLLLAVGGLCIFSVVVYGLTSIARRFQRIKRG